MNKRLKAALAVSSVFYLGACNLSSTPLNVRPILDPVTAAEAQQAVRDSLLGASPESAMVTVLPSAAGLVLEGTAPVSEWRYIPLSVLQAQGASLPQSEVQRGEFEGYTFYVLPSRLSDPESSSSESLRASASDTRSCRLEQYWPWKTCVFTYSGRDIKSFTATPSYDKALFCLAQAPAGLHWSYKANSVWYWSWETRDFSRSGQSITRNFPASSSFRIKVGNGGECLNSSRDVEVRVTY